MFLSKVSNDLVPVDLDKLAQNTDHYSSDDIYNMVSDAAKMYGRRVMDATHFKQVTGGLFPRDLWTPCDSKDEGAIEMDWCTVPRTMAEDQYSTCRVYTIVHVP